MVVLTGARSTLRRTAALIVAAALLAGCSAFTDEGASVHFRISVPAGAIALREPLPEDVATRCTFVPLRWCRSPESNRDGVATGRF